MKELNWFLSILRASFLGTEKYIRGSMLKENPLIEKFYTTFERCWFLLDRTLE
jgi:hypothetical protein